VFDRYVGLGVDCEVVVQLRRVTGQSQAQVFDWQLLPHTSLVGVLRADFVDYFQQANLVLSEDRKHVLDTLTAIEFHHLFTPNFDGTILLQRIGREYPDVRARMDHLLRRWRETLNSELSVLYVRRDPFDEFTAEELFELRDVLRASAPTHRFALLWARDPEAAGAQELADQVVELGDGVYAAGVAVAQPRDVLWRGDDTAWDRLYPKIRELRPVDC
jgi:hypothetical protein